MIVYVHAMERLRNNKTLIEVHQLRVPLLDSGIMERERNCCRSIQESPEMTVCWSNIEYVLDCHIMWSAIITKIRNVHLVYFPICRFLVMKSSKTLHGFFNFANI